MRAIHCSHLWAMPASTGITIPGLGEDVGLLRVDIDEAGVVLAGQRVLDATHEDVKVPGGDGERLRLWRRNVRRGAHGQHWKAPTRQKML